MIDRPGAGRKDRRKTRRRKDQVMEVGIQRLDEALIGKRGCKRKPHDCPT
jgi:hypothetical protein